MDKKEYLRILFNEHKNIIELFQQIEDDQKYEGLIEGIIEWLRNNIEDYKENKNYKISEIVESIGDIDSTVDDIITDLHNIEEDKKLFNDRDGDLKKLKELFDNSRYFSDIEKKYGDYKISFNYDIFTNAWEDVDIIPSDRTKLSKYLRNRQLTPDKLILRIINKVYGEESKDDKDLKDNKEEKDGKEESKRERDSSKLKRMFNTLLDDNDVTIMDIDLYDDYNISFDYKKFMEAWEETVGTPSKKQRLSKYFKNEISVDDLISKIITKIHGEDEKKKNAILQLSNDLKQIIDKKDYKKYESIISNLNANDIDKTIIIINSIDRNFIIDFILEDKKRVKYFKVPILDIRLIDLFINMDKKIDYSPQNSPSDNVNSFFIKTNFGYILSEALKTTNVKIVKYLFTKYKKSIDDLNDLQLIDIVISNSLVDEKINNEQLEMYSFLIDNGYCLDDGMMIKLVNIDDMNILPLFKKFISKFKFTQENVAINIYNVNKTSYEKIKLLYNAIPNNLKKIFLKQTASAEVLFYSFNDSKEITNEITNMRHNERFVTNLIKFVIKDDNKDYKSLDLIPKLISEFDREELKEIAMWLYNYKEPFVSKLNDIEIEGKDIKSRNESRRKLRKDVDLEIVRYRNVSGRKQSVLFEILKIIQKKMNLSILDLKYCHDKDDLMGDPLDSKNELTIFQRYEEKVGKVFGDCYNTEEVVIMSEPTDLVYRWKGQDGNENYCCPLKDQRVIKLPRTGIWVIVSIAMLRTFKYFQLISIGNQKIGSAFGISALHNATEQLWRCIPCHNSDIEKGFQDQKIIPNYSMKLMKEDLTSFDPLDLYYKLEKKDQCDINLLATGHLLILLKEQNGLIKDVINSEKYDTKYIKDYKPDNVVKRRISEDECKTRKDCEDGNSCLYEDGRGTCVKNEDIGHEEGECYEDKDCKEEQKCNREFEDDNKGVCI